MSFGPPSQFPPVPTTFAGGVPDADFLDALFEDQELNIFDWMPSPTPPLVPSFPHLERLVASSQMPSTPPPPKPANPLIEQLQCHGHFYEMQDQFETKYASFDPGENVDTHPLHKSLQAIGAAFIREKNTFSMAAMTIDGSGKRVQKHELNFIAILSESNALAQELCAFISDPETKKVFEIAARRHIYTAFLTQCPNPPTQQKKALDAFLTRDRTLPAYSFNKTPLPSKISVAVNFGRETFQSMFRTKRDDGTPSEWTPSMPEAEKPLPDSFSLSTPTLSVETPASALTKVLSDPKYLTFKQLLETSDRSYHPFHMEHPINVMLAQIMDDLVMDPDFSLRKTFVKVGRFKIQSSGLQLNARSKALCDPYIDEICSMAFSEDQRILLSLAARHLLCEAIRPQGITKAEDFAVLDTIETNDLETPLALIGLFLNASFETLSKVRTDTLTPFAQKAKELIEASLSSTVPQMTFKESFRTFHPLLPDSNHPIHNWIRNRVKTFLFSQSSPFKMETTANAEVSPLIAMLCATVDTPLEKAVLEVAVRQHIIKQLKAAILDDRISFELNTPNILKSIEMNDDQIPESLISAALRNTDIEACHATFAPKSPPALLPRPASASPETATNPVPEVGLPSLEEALIEVSGASTSSSNSALQENKPARLLLWLFETSAFSNLSQIADLQKGFDPQDPSFHALAAQFHSMELEDKGAIYGNLWLCANQPNIPNFGKQYIFSNTQMFYRAFVRFLSEKLSTETLLSAYSELSSEQREKTFQGLVNIKQMLEAGIPPHLHPETLEQLEKITKNLLVQLQPQSVAPPLPPRKKVQTQTAPVAPPPPTSPVPVPSANTSSSAVEFTGALLSRAKNGLRSFFNWEKEFFWENIPIDVSAWIKSTIKTDAWKSLAAKKWVDSTEEQLKTYRVASEQFLTQLSSFGDTLSCDDAKGFFHKTLALHTPVDTDWPDDERSLTAITESLIDPIFDTAERFISKEELRSRFEKQMAQIENSLSFVETIKAQLPDLRKFTSLTQLRVEN